MRSLFVFWLFRRNSLNDYSIHYNIWLCIHAICTRNMSKLACRVETSFTCQKACSDHVNAVLKSCVDTSIRNRLAEFGETITISRLVKFDYGSAPEAHYLLWGHKKNSLLLGAYRNKMHVQVGGQKWRGVQSGRKSEHFFMNGS